MRYADGGAFRLRAAQHHWALAHIIAKHFICRGSFLRRQPTSLLISFKKISKNIMNFLYKVRVLCYNICVKIFFP